MALNWPSQKLGRPRSLKLRPKDFQGEEKIFYQRERLFRHGESPFPPSGDLFWSQKGFSRFKDSRLVPGRECPTAKLLRRSGSLTTKCRRRPPCWRGRLGPLRSLGEGRGACCICCASSPGGEGREGRRLDPPDLLLSRCYKALSNSNCSLTS